VQQQPRQPTAAGQASFKPRTQHGGSFLGGAHAHDGNGSSGNGCVDTDVQRDSRLLSGDTFTSALHEHDDVHGESAGHRKDGPLASYIRGAVEKEPDHEGSAEHEGEVHDDVDVKGVATEEKQKLQGEEKSRERMRRVVHGPATLQRGADSAGESKAAAAELATDIDKRATVLAGLAVAPAVPLRGLRRGERQWLGRLVRRVVGLRRAEQR